jgi:hypothetical protein
MQWLFNVTKMLHDDEGRTEDMMLLPFWMQVIPAPIKGLAFPRKTLSFDNVPFSLPDYSESRISFYFGALYYSDRFIN